MIHWIPVVVFYYSSHYWALTPAPPNGKIDRELNLHLQSYPIAVEVVVIWIIKKSTAESDVPVVWKSVAKFGLVFKKLKGKRRQLLILTLKNSLLVKLFAWGNTVCILYWKNHMIHGRLMSFPYVFIPYFTGKDNYSWMQVTVFVWLAILAISWCLRRATLNIEPMLSISNT